MMRSFQFGAALAVLLLSVAPAQAQDRRMTPELLWKLARVGGASLSPDGQELLFSVRRYELAKNGGDSDLHAVPLAGGAPRAVTSGAGSESSAQWVRTADGVRIFAIAATEKDGRQVVSIDPASGARKQVTSHPGGIDSVKVSPTGQHLLYTATVRLDQTVNDLYKDLPEADARIIDGLLYRHWDAWHDYAYSHLFLAPIGDDGRAGEGRDLMAGLRVDCPVPPFGGEEQYSWAPDGKELAFTMKLVANPAESTDTDVYTVEVAHPERRRCLTPGRNGYDMEPVYSPDGRWLAFHSMERPGFESDRNRILLHDRRSGAIFDLTEGLDQTAHGATFAPDSQSVYFMSEWRGTDQIFRIDLRDRTLTQVTRGQYNWRLDGVSKDGTSLVLGRQSMLRPTELYRWDLKTAAATRLTGFNDEHYKDLALPRIEERWTVSSDGEKVHSWVILPPDFDGESKIPLITYCQGGPQGQIGQWFSYRWSFHLMAAQGYAVVAPNRRGLPGFGRAWNDQISGDWGGQAMQDILAVTDDMLTEPWVDADKLSAVGASFGGYTVYWLMGHHEDRFQAMIAHCGVFNLESMYGSTEELFFVNWDLGGPYWRSDALQADYDRFSPHRFVRNWKTPLLVIHGERDFRVPVTQGMEAFTAAQVEGVPSRFLYFPDEGHWVLSPQNGVLWHRVFFDWLQRHAPVGG